MRGIEAGGGGGGGGVTVPELRRNLNDHEGRNPERE